jgi:hypothetical protein
MSTWGSALLAAIFEALMIRDLRARDAGLVFFTIRRLETPVTYWALIGFEGMLALLLGLFAIAAATVGDDCNAIGVCTVTIHAPSSAL